jgi:hypothetical protein
MAASAKAAAWAAAEEKKEEAAGAETENAAAEEEAAGTDLQRQEQELGRRGWQWQPLQRQQLRRRSVGGRGGVNRSRRPCPGGTVQRRPSAAGTGPAVETRAACQCKYGAG